MEIQSPAERIRSTRARLDEKLNGIEKNLFLEISSRSPYLGALLRATKGSLIEESGSGNLVSSPEFTALELTELEKKIDELQEQNAEVLQEKVELTGQITLFEQEMSRLHETVARLGGEAQVLRQTLARKGNRRRKGVALWRKKILREKIKTLQAGETESKSVVFQKINDEVSKNSAESLKKYEEERKSREESQKKNEELTRQIFRLTSELDSALELVAELRDELHGVSRGKT